MADDDLYLEQHTERIRNAVIDAFASAYRDAGMRGLCPDGCLEAALEAARKVDLRFDQAR